MSAEDADDDLYADLVGESGAAGDTVIRTQNAALKQRVREQDEALQKLAKQLRDSEALVASLRAENETLERNISCLYRTAVLEIARKDKLLAKYSTAAFKTSKNSKKRPPKHQKHAQILEKSPTHSLR